MKSGKHEIFLQIILDTKNSGKNNLFVIRNIRNIIRNIIIRNNLFNLLIHIKKIKI